MLIFVELCISVLISKYIFLSYRDVLIPTYIVYILQICIKGYHSTATFYKALKMFVT